ncbi:hypothetical protein scyTo_0008681 [Scyliorhinus torazame]|uniref:RNA helicase n=1 Tax=Scyliorhinus torazame TaxID=75743 RepID=A0A401PCF9_SCYTO|nr:hypothetical protein [Scyliorhinus torazame]
MGRCELVAQMTKVEDENSSSDQKVQLISHKAAFPEADADSSLLEKVDDEDLPNISLLTSRPILSTLKTITYIEVAGYRYPELPITKYREQVGLEKEVGTDTQLTYMTTGVLLQKIVNAKCLTEFTHIFIDEVHERTEEMDFLLLVVRKLLRTNSRFVKVILMSATINCIEFADYFAVPFRKSLTPAYVFEVEGIPYSVDEYYLDDLKELTHFQIAPSFSNEPKILPEVYNVAETLILYFDELESKENGLHVYPLHSSVTLEEQSNVFLTPVPGYRKVGALSVEMKGVENPYDGDLTFLGKVLAYLPVDLHLGKLVVLGYVFGCLEECLIIAAALSLKNFFAMPFKQHLEGYRNKMEFSDGTLSDCIALVNAFKAELEWGKSNYVQIKRIKEVAQLYEELKERVQCFNMYIDRLHGCTDEEYVHKQRFILQVVLAGAFYPNYFTFGPVSQEIAVKELARKDYRTTVVVRNVSPYGFLYYQQLQSLFRQCGQVGAISFDGSKLLKLDIFGVFFVDYGNTAKVATNLLRNIPHNLMEHPFQISHEQLKTMLQFPLQEKLGLNQQTTWTQKEEDWKLIQALVKKFSSSKLGFPISKVHLHGPFNPYETKFHSMTTMSRFRTDRLRKRYIGALCGLGWNPITNAPLLEEHELEVAFDVHFDVNDILEVV